MNTLPGCSSQFDNVFDQIIGLSWRPWVGAQWSERPADQRLLLVAESHYANGNSAEEIDREAIAATRARSLWRVS